MANKIKYVLFLLGLIIIIKNCILNSKNKEKSYTYVPLPPSLVKENLDTTYLTGVYKPEEVDTLPIYKGGEIGFLKYVEVNTKNPYPDIDIEGTVYLSCVVEINGTLTNIRVVRGVPSSWNEEAIRILTGSSGNWKSGVIKNKAVRTFIHIPIKCKIR